MDDEDDTRDELAQFLKKVDNIESVVKALQSSDDAEVANALKVSEDLLKQTESKVGYNRTSINRNPSVPNPSDPNDGPNGPNMPQGSAQSMQQDEFMRVFEEDARRRAENRQKRLAAASKFKEAGNAAFKQGKYEESITEYSRAIETMRDFEVGYTNRALAYIELRRFDEALVDCDFALRIDEKNTKAMFVRAKALAASGKVEAAREQYEAAARVDNKLEKLVKQRIAELTGSTGDAAVQQPNATVDSTERSLTDLLGSLNLFTNEELKGISNEDAVKLTATETFPKRVSQLLVEAAPARNRCDLELLRNASKKSRHALEAFTLLTKLVSVNGEILRAVHYCASRWIDVYLVSAVSRSSTALNVGSGEMHSLSACIIEYALTYIANGTLQVENKVSSFPATDFEQIARALIEVYLLKLIKLVPQANAVTAVGASAPCNLEVLLDRALIVAARSFRFVPPLPSDDEQSSKFYNDLLDALLRVLDNFVFRSSKETKNDISKPSDQMPTTNSKHELALRKHSLLCLVSAVRLFEKDVGALYSVLAAFDANLSRFRQLCEELVTSADCVTLGNIAVLLQNFVRTKHTFRQCLVDVLLRDDAAGLKRLLAVLAGDRALEVTNDWQVYNASDDGAQSEARAQSTRKLLEQTKANVAILLGKLTQPAFDSEVNADLKQQNAESATGGTKGKNEKATAAENRRAKSKRAEEDDQATTVDELSYRLTDQFRRLHAFEILHGTMHLIQ